MVYLREQEDATHPDGTKSLRGSITKLTNVHAKAIVGMRWVRMPLVQQQLNKCLLSFGTFDTSEGSKDHRRALELTDV